MALTRKMLKAMGIDDEKIDQIIEAHTETVDGLKDKLKTAESDADKVKDLQKELDDLKKDNKDGEGWKTKYEKEHKDFEDYKKDITAKETMAAKEKAARSYFEGKGITGANLEIAMRGAKDEIEAITLDGEAIKDAKAFDDLIAGTYAGLVGKTKKQGADTKTPPGNGGQNEVKTKADIMKIRNTAERQREIAAHPELFGLRSEE